MERPPPTTANSPGISRSNVCRTSLRQLAAGLPRYRQLILSTTCAAQASSFFNRCSFSPRYVPAERFLPDRIGHIVRRNLCMNMYAHTPLSCVCGGACNTCVYNACENTNMSPLFVCLYKQNNMWPVIRERRTVSFTYPVRIANVHHFLPFLLHDRRNVHASIVEPTQSVCDQVMILAPRASDDDHTLLVRLLAERPRRPCVAHRARERYQHSLQISLHPAYRRT
mmetsp:Transcript_29311/g.54873  ORF Transcript_29311/g.54873 Transcript_29311/m.54873 type:complete len:225 (+) Transcript_29311:302-976(+)